MQDSAPTMRGVWLIGHGDFDQLAIRDDIPLPQIGATDVLIKVSAAGVNNTDINTRIGWYSKQDRAAEDAALGGHSNSIASHPRGGCVWSDCRRWRSGQC